MRGLLFPDDWPVTSRCLVCRFQMPGLPFPDAGPVGPDAWPAISRCMARHFQLLGLSIPNAWPVVSRCMACQMLGLSFPDAWPVVSRCLACHFRNALHCVHCLTSFTDELTAVVVCCCILREKRSPRSGQAKVWRQERQRPPRLVICWSFRCVCRGLLQSYP